MIQIPLHSFKFHHSTLISAIILFYSISFLVFTSCTPTVRTIRKQTEPSKARSIRLFIEEFSNPKSIKFSTDVYLNEATGLTKIAKGTSLNLRLINGQIKLRYGRHDYTGVSFKVLPGTGTLNYNGKEFKGEIKFLIRSSQIVVINNLDIEDYLKGVLAGEMGIAANENDYEALKAFTVCARNFAYMKINENKPDFDVYGDTRDQVYASGSESMDLIKRAVEETADLVLLHRTDLANTFYFSSCGGHTEDYTNVFKGEGNSYLRSVQDGGNAYCSISPSFSWTETYSFHKIIEFMRNSKLIDRGDYSIDRITVRSWFPSGRIKELEINLSGDENKQVILKGNNIRYVIRGNNSALLKSTLCRLTTKGQQLIIEGKGFGHGVGLCQWGAIGQAREGKSFEEILYFYFPGTKIERRIPGIRGLSNIEKKMYD